MIDKIKAFFLSMKSVKVWIIAAVVLGWGVIAYVIGAITGAWIQRLIG